MNKTGCDMALCKCQQCDLDMRVKVKVKLKGINCC